MKRPQTSRWLSLTLAVWLFSFPMQHAHAQSAPPGFVPVQAEYFTGTAWLRTLVPANDLTDCLVSEVIFEPKARNH